VDDSAGPVTEPDLAKRQWLNVSAFPG
jgi:hypothetical protein